MKYKYLVLLITFLTLMGGCLSNVTSSKPCQIAFEGVQKTTTEGNINANSDIYIMDCDGSKKTQLTYHPGFDFYPDWSPDGEQIAYGSYRGKDFEIYIMNADGSDKRNFSNHPADDIGPSWSPDGKWIAFYSNRDGDDMEIYIQSVEGEEVIQITDNNFEDSEPTWSPGGDRLAFIQAQDEYGVSGVLTIVSIEDLTIEAAFPDIHPSRQPAWSPDGRWVVLNLSLDTSGEIFAVNILNQQYVQITQGSLSEKRIVNGDASWSPDGSKLVFHSNRGGENFEIYIMNRDGTDVKKIPNIGWEDWSSHDPDWRP